MCALIIKSCGQTDFMAHRLSLHPEVSSQLSMYNEYTYLSHWAPYDNIHVYFACIYNMYNHMQTYMYKC